MSPVGMGEETQLAVTLVVAHPCVGLSSSGNFYVSDFKCLPSGDTHGTCWKVELCVTRWFKQTPETAKTYLKSVANTDLN